MTNTMNDAYEEIYLEGLKEKSREQRLEWLEAKEEQAEAEVKSIELTIQRVRELEDSTKGEVARAEVKQFKNKLTAELSNAYEELGEIQESITFVTEN